MHGNKIPLPTVLILFTILFAVPAPAQSAPSDQGAVVSFRNYVIVTLKDKTYERFDLDTFQFPWVAFEITNEVTCDRVAFDVEEVAEIHVLNMGRNECEQRDDRLYDLFFRNRPPLFGFLEVQEEVVRGTSLGSGKEVAIPFQEIEKISFFRRGN